MDEEFDTYEAPDYDLNISGGMEDGSVDMSDFSMDNSGDTSFDMSDFSADTSFENLDFSEDTSNDISFDAHETENYENSDNFSEDTYTDTDNFDYNNSETESSDTMYNGYDGYEGSTNEYDDGGDPKTLTRDEHELLETGYNNVEQQLEVLEDDYRDKGLSDEEIQERLADDRYRLQQDFLNDAFPGQEVSPHVFNGFRENGSQDMIDDIENYESVRDRLAPGTESSVGESDLDTFPEDTTDDYDDIYQESIDGDMDTLDFEEDTEDNIGTETLDSTFDNEENFAEDTYENEVIEAERELNDDAMHTESVDNEPVDLDDIDYDAIYEGIEADALAEGFKDVNLDTDTERLNDSLSNFDSDTWENLSLDDQKESMQNLADYVSDITGLENPPKIEYYNNETEGDFGGYDPSTNTLQVNEYMLYNSDEAADTIAHELWHAHQHERASNPQSALDFQYQHNFENYISPDLDQQAYEDQLVEAEARAFASQFKDRLRALKG